MTGIAAPSLLRQAGTLAKMPNTPRVRRLAGCGLAVRDGKVLLVRSGTEWMLPGGGVEHGEHPVDTVVRELVEETGLDVTVDSFFEVVSNRRESGGKDFHNVVLVYTVTVTGGVLRDEVDGSTQEARWVPIAELDDLPLLPGAAATLRRYLGG